MSDNQKATLSLNLVVESCKVAVIALSEDNTNEDYPITDFTTLRADFMSILSLLHAASTKVALSLKPSSPQHKASLTPLKDLANNIAALVYCIRLMLQTRGAIVISEYENVAREVISSIEYFAQSFLTPSADESTQTDRYLVGIGKVHELIDNAKKPGGLSLNNRDAVRKKWLQDHEALADGVEEIQEMCNPTDIGGGDGEDEEPFDDGWEELGLSSKEPFSPDEKNRAEKVHGLVKFVSLMHKRVVSNVLSPDAHEMDDTTLSQLATLSGKLLTASDDLISSMYAPQEPSVITSYLEVLFDVLRDLQKVLVPEKADEPDKRPDAQPLSSQVGDKSIKWFIACFDQMEKTGRKISDTLAN